MDPVDQLVMELQNHLDAYLNSKHQTLLHQLKRQEDQIALLQHQCKELNRLNLVDSTTKNRMIDSLKKEIESLSSHVLEQNEEIIRLNLEKA